MQGFDNVCNSIIIGMVPFQKQFGVLDASNPASYIIPARYLGAWQGATQAGSLIGAFLAGYMMDSMLGRKKTIIIACAISCIGVGVQYSAVEWTTYFAGKLVNGMYSHGSDTLNRGQVTNKANQDLQSASGSPQHRPGSVKMRGPNVVVSSSACTTAPSSSARHWWPLSDKGQSPYPGGGATRLVFCCN
jgi:hypothetical protein